MPKRRLKKECIPEYLTQRLSERLQQRYPNLEVITFDAAQTITSGDYQQKVLVGERFSTQNSAVRAGQHLHQKQAQVSYDVFKSLFLNDYNLK